MFGVYKKTKRAMGPPNSHIACWKKGRFRIGLPFSFVVLMVPCGNIRFRLGFTGWKRHGWTRRTILRYGSHEASFSGVHRKSQGRAHRLCGIGHSDSLGFAGLLVRSTRSAVYGEFGAWDIRNNPTHLNQKRVDSHYFLYLIVCFLRHHLLTVNVKRMSFRRVRSSMFCV